MVKRQIIGARKTVLVVFRIHIIRCFPQASGLSSTPVNTLTCQINDLGNRDEK